MRERILSNVALIGVIGSWASSRAAPAANGMSISGKGFHRISSSDRRAGAKCALGIDKIDAGRNERAIGSLELAEGVLTCTACVVTPVTHLDAWISPVGAAQLRQPHACEYSSAQTHLPVKR